MTRTLGSFLLGSRDPERLRAWYRDTLAPDHAGDEPIAFGGTQLIIDGCDDIDDRNPEPGRALVTFVVDDALATTVRMNEVGVSWLGELEPRPAGFIGTLLDPDGNRLQIVQRRDSGAVSR